MFSSAAPTSVSSTLGFSVRRRTLWAQELCEQAEVMCLGDHTSSRGLRRPRRSFAPRSLHPSCRDHEEC